MFVTAAGWLTKCCCVVVNKERNYYYTTSPRLGFLRRSERQRWSLSCIFYGRVRQLRETRRYMKLNYSMNWLSTTLHLYGGLLHNWKAIKKRGSGKLQLKIGSYVSTGDILTCVPKGLRHRFCRRSAPVATTNWMLALNFHLLSVVASRQQQQEHQ